MGTMQAVLFTLSLIVAPGPGYVCTVVEAGPRAIEVFCVHPHENKTVYGVIKRDGTLRVIEGRSL